MSDVLEYGAVPGRLVGPSEDPLRPSEYTAFLIQALQRDRARVKGVRALEMGCGSGVVLVALGGMGAGRLCGIDIESEAIHASRRLADCLGYKDIAEFHCGNMWQPVAGRRFDLIVANLPHFPADHVACAGRLPSWSRGGSNGRCLLDPFLEGLAEHLAAGGRAVITHNAFLGLQRSREILAQHGLALRVLITALLHIHEEKIRRITSHVLQIEQGRSIFSYGPYVFAKMHIVEIRSREGLN